jgi:hypothetical protein
MTVINAFKAKRDPDAWAAMLEAAEVTVDLALEDLATLAAAGLGSERASTVAELIDGWADTEVLAQALPRQFVNCYTLRFLKQFTVCLVEVAAKLASPFTEPLACTAEELALAAILDRARALREARADAQSEGPAADALDVVEDLAFEDTDFLHLFSPQDDGIDETDAGQYLGMQSLRFENWLRPFAEGYLVHPFLRQPTPGSAEADE